MSAYLRAHYDAVQALIPDGVKVYSGEVEDKPTYPYVLLAGGIGQESGESLAGTPDHLEMRPKVTYAAATFPALLTLVSTVRPALLDALPVVPGWVPSRLRQASLMDAQPDFKVIMPGGKAHPQFCVDEFPFTSQRA